MGRLGEVAALGEHAPGQLHARSTRASAWWGWVRRRNRSWRTASTTIPATSAGSIPCAVTSTSTSFTKAWSSVGSVASSAGRWPSEPTAMSVATMPGHRAVTFTLEPTSARSAARASVAARAANFEMPYGPA
ncbi:MAG: hypothetical protein R2746_17825 [Acidimicrobiales bacterium]